MCVYILPVFCRELRQFLMMSALIGLQLGEP